MANGEEKTKAHPQARRMTREKIEDLFDHKAAANDDLRKMIVIGGDP